MGIGFLHAMTPAFRKLYKDNKDLRIEAMQRHTSFFNCEPWSGVIYCWTGYGDGRTEGIGS